MNRKSLTSGDVDVVIFWSTMVENVVVAVGIMSVMSLETEVRSTYGPAKNSDMSTEGALGYAGRSRHRKELR